MSFTNNIKKEYFLFIVILLAHSLFTIFLHNSIDPVHYIPQNFFVLELIEKRMIIPFEILFLLDMGNMVILWLIGKKVFHSKFSLIPPLVYAISPWSSYLVSGGSFYVYLSFLVLVMSYGLFLIKGEKRSTGLILLGSTAVVALYSSFLMMVIIPIIFLSLIISKIYALNIFKNAILILVISMVPLLLLIAVYQMGFKNIISNEIQIFSDPGLINMVNKYQGDARQEGFGRYAKLAENRYIFYLEFILLKISKQFAPSTFFTSQEKLLRFSFTAPIFFGFLMPFFYGFYKVFKSSYLRNVLFISGILVIPSVLSKYIVDLNRLAIFIPVLIFIISFGLSEIFKQKRKNRVYLFVILSIILVLFQLTITVSDINFREKPRFVKYYGENYEIGKQ